MPKKPFRLSVKVIILDKNSRCLLLKRSLNSRGNPGKWEFPGGKIDPGENFDEGLIREVAEETGLHVSLHRVLGTAESESPTAKIVYLLFEGRRKSGRVYLSSEHDDYMWASRESLPSLALAPQFGPFAVKYARGET
jgi:8-oxo-dGTP diphosphatase